MEPGRVWFRDGDPWEEYAPPWHQAQGKSGIGVGGWVGRGSGHVQRAGGTGSGPAHDVGVDHRRFDAGMAQQVLHGPDVDSSLQKAGGEGGFGDSGIRGLGDSENRERQWQAGRLRMASPGRGRPPSFGLGRTRRLGPWRRAFPECTSSESSNPRERRNTRAGPSAGNAGAE